MKVILLERVEKLGQMGDVVDGEGRLRPQLPAAAEEGAARHRAPTGRSSRASARDIEARNAEAREAAAEVAARSSTASPSC